MANKIISFGTNENLLNEVEDSVAPSKESLIVYSDVNMEATSSGYSISAIMPLSLSSMSQWDMQKSTNVKAVFNSLHNIFTWHRGERILLPEFGSQLQSLLYEGITPATEEAIMAEIRSCVSEWEPRVQIASVVNASTVEDTENNVIHLEVIFTIPSLGEEQYAYSFSYTQGS